MIQSDVAQMSWRSFCRLLCGSALLLAFLSSGSALAADRKRPSKPGKFTAENFGRSMLLGWKASTDNDRVDRYLILRNGDWLAEREAQPVDARISYFDELGVKESTDYSYMVIAIDASENESKPARATATSSAEFVKPTPPILYAKYEPALGTRPADLGVLLTWEPPDEDLWSYTLSRDGAFLAEVSAHDRSYLDTGVTPGSPQTYTYQLAAWDPFANISSSEVEVTVSSAPLANGSCDRYVRAGADGDGDGTTDAIGGEHGAWTMTQLKTKYDTRPGHSGLNLEPGYHVCLDPIDGPFFEGLDFYSAAGNGDSAADPTVIKGRYSNVETVLKSTDDDAVGNCIKMLSQNEFFEFSHLTCDGFEGKEGELCYNGDSREVLYGPPIDSSRMRYGVKSVSSNNNAYHHLTIRHMASRGAHFSGSSYNRFTDNRVLHSACERSGTVPPGSHGNHFIGEGLEVLTGSHHNLFANNTLVGAQHTLFANSGAPYNIYKNNRFNNRTWANAYLVQNRDYVLSEHTLLDGNSFESAFTDTGDGPDPDRIEPQKLSNTAAGLFLRGGYAIVRNNRFINNLGPGIGFSANNSSVWPGQTGDPLQAQDLSHNRVYQNDIVGNGFGAILLRDLGSLIPPGYETDFSSGVIMNNRIEDNGLGNEWWPKGAPCNPDNPYTDPADNPCPPHPDQRDWEASVLVTQLEDVTMAPFFPSDLRFFSNAVDGLPAQEVFWIEEDATDPGTPSDHRTLGAVQAALPGNVYDNLQHFSGAALDNMTANAGSALAQVQTCSGDVITVDDAYFFSAGISGGAADYPGDLITIEGLGTPLWRIVDIDYAAGAVTLNASPCGMGATGKLVSLAYDPGQSGSHIGINSHLDTDADSVIDILDNCTDVANVDQQDQDDDGIGDACPGGPSGLWCQGQTGCAAP